MTPELLTALKNEYEQNPTPELKMVIEQFEAKEIKENKRYLYAIKTKDGTGEFNFFTNALDSKDALKKLIENSYDFKNIVKHDNDIKIIINKISPTNP